MTILSVHGLNKYFDGFAAVKDVSFTLERGEVLAIIGASGSGKTTLLRCLNFLETPDAGVITVDGQTLFDAADAWRGVRQSEAQIRRNRLHFGLVFQQFNLFPQYTALRNVTIGPELLARENPFYKYNKHAMLAGITAEAKALLASVGLANRMNHYPTQLSGGQQQRVAIARALALKPDILCFDEPTSALDPELTGEVLKVIKSLAAQHTTMIIVTHEMGFASEVADRVIFMDEGTVLADGAPKDILEHPDNPRIQAFLRKISQEEDEEEGAASSGVRRLEHVAITDPAGNITALVFDDLRHLGKEARAALQGEIIAAALEAVPGAPAVEQCGFVTPDGKLEMFGGEFCGNATRSLLHLFGAGNPVSVEMPLPPGGVDVTETERGWLVPFDGITHLVVTDKEKLVGGSVRDTMAGILQDGEYGFAALPAAGVTYFDEGSGAAAFSLWVRDMGTMYAERSCGSGSAAVAAAVAKRGGRDAALTVLQPSGDTLKAAAAYDPASGNITKVFTEGSVRILYEGSLAW
jgi:polar amino acid transport system ATP-binding protein